MNDPSQHSVREMLIPALHAHQHQNTALSNGLNSPPPKGKETLLYTFYTSVFLQT
jgi:hypothetical protein